MKLQKLKPLSALLAAVLLTACSAETERIVFPIIGTAAEEEIPSEPKLHQGSSTSDENSEDSAKEIPITMFTGAAGESLRVSSAKSVIVSQCEPNPGEDFILNYDHAYFTYATPFYQRDFYSGSRSRKKPFFLDTPELTDKYNFYLKNKSVTYTVTRGDILENGLICTDARTCYIYRTNGYNPNPEISFSEAAFSGELTLTGTICCEQEDGPFTEKGSLYFIADSDNGNIPDQYDMYVTYNAEQGDGLFFYEGFRLCNISELPEEQAKLIENSEYTDVKVTVKNIRLYCENNGTTFSKSADLTDMKLI